MKFTMPFGDILKAYKVSVPANTELTQYVEVEFENGKVKFSFPPNAFMDVVNIAIAFIPNVAQPTLQKIFKDSAPQVTFEKFEVDVKDGTVDIKLKVTGKPVVVRERYYFPQLIWVVKQKNRILLM